MSPCRRWPHFRGVHKAGFHCVHSLVCYDILGCIVHPKVDLYLAPIQLEQGTAWTCHGYIYAHWYVMTH